MNYFNIIFSNRSILRIFQLEAFKKFKIAGEIIEFGASEKKDKNFCSPNLDNCKITFSNINPSNKDYLNIDLQKTISLNTKFDYIVIFNVLEHLLDANLALRNLSAICKKMEKSLVLLLFFLGFMAHQKITQGIQKIT